MTKRLVKLAKQRGAMPNASIAQSSGGIAEMRAAYRFYDNENITMEQIQEPHLQSTVKRMRQHEVVLALQDTTLVNLTSHPHTKGVGYLQDLQHTGYLLHTTLMVTPNREPLGIIQQQVWVRDPSDYGKRHKRKKRTTAEKESQKWLNSLRKAREVQDGLSKSQIVSVGDSEADMYALYAAAHEIEQSFLVRASRDRLILDEDERHLWQHLEQQPLSGVIEIDIQRQSNRPARTARLSVRMAQIELKKPSTIHEGLTATSLTAWAILAQEKEPQEGEENIIEWRLLTNVPTETFKEACERIQWYGCRWVVEMFHRVLKSGCRLEERQFDDIENIKRFLAIDSVVAWRVLYMTMLNRQSPELSCDTILETYEWQALYCFIHKTNQLPTQKPTLVEVVGWIAHLGGFTASHPHHPGTTVLWRGLSRLADISQAWLAFHPDSSP